MEVRPGYKQTEVGVIPEDWDVSHSGTRSCCRMTLADKPAWTAIRLPLW